jgi:hypothetical protein
MTASRSTIRDVGDALGAARGDVGRIAADADGEADRARARSAAAARQDARRLLTEIQRTKAEIEREVATLEAASARFAEAAASASAALVELSAKADFSAPGLTGGLQSAVQSKREAVAE